jgi:hypothetical protein
MSRLGLAHSHVFAFAFLSFALGCASGSTTSDEALPAGDRAETGIDASLGDLDAVAADARETGIPDPRPEIPEGEVCGNGFDDNGNGQIDEGCSCIEGRTQACFPGAPKFAGVGACVMGTQTCVPRGEWAEWGPCVGAVLPKAEVCDGTIDEDCDGQVDETCECSDGEKRACGSAVGACVQGSQSCVEGKWQECVGAVGPRDETCDGTLDEDCDGTVDEGCDCANGTTRSCGTSAVGACRLGTQTCERGVWGACTGAVLPQAREICEGSVDDDCDGVIDNGCECANGATRVCGVGKGVCTLGKQTCEGGRWQACEGATWPSAEICNGAADEDCDGVVDNGCDCTNGQTRACGSAVGACVQGAQTCVDGKWQACLGGRGPTAETCNGIDDDCDGVADPGCACVNGSTRSCGSAVGRCKQGTQTCAGGQWGACVGAVNPIAEVCGNGIDDNCNGRVDEGCIVDIAVNVNGDCKTIACPAATPYPVGCQLDFGGGDDRGCVANVPNQSSVFLKEGNDCGVGRVVGTLKCSNTRGTGLTPDNCKINKKSPRYVRERKDCPGE